MFGESKGNYLGNIIFLKVFLLLFILSMFTSFGGCSRDDGEDDKLPPTSNFEVLKGDFEITLIWDDVPGTSYYNLYYTINNENVTKENAIKISYVTSPYIHRNLSTNIYCYVVTAMKGSWESLVSSQVCVDFRDHNFKNLLWDQGYWDQNVWGE